MKKLSTPLYALITLALTLAAVAGAGRFFNPSTPNAARAARPQPSPVEGQDDAGAPREASEAERAQVVESLSRMPLYFEENLGQAGAGVRFYSRAGNHTLLLSPTEVVLSLRGDEGGRAASLRMRMEGASPKPEVAGEDERPGRVNYIRPRPLKSHTNVATFARVRHRGIYPGVDAVFYGNQRQLEYDFRVAAGADPSRIRLSFEGAETLKVDAAGDLRIQTAAGEVRQLKPFTYQEQNGARTEVASRYVVGPEGEVSFELADYDRSRELVIDPVLAYSTYFGSTGNDVINGLAVDADGNAYVTGSAFGLIPTTEGAHDRTLNGQDIFVTKLNASGALVYSTYISAISGNNEAKAIAVDASGNAHVTGQAVSSVFTATAGAFDSTHNGGVDAFVVKLNAAGSALLYASYFGTSGSEFANAIALDAGGDIYVAGHTRTTNLPTKNALQTSYAGGSQNGEGDAFLARLSPDGAGAADLVYSTYLGGAGDERANGVAADAAGNAYVVGFTSSAGFPTTAGAFDAGHNGQNDGFVTKVDTGAVGASSLAYSTFLGGAGGDQLNAVVIDGATPTNVYVAGNTASSAATFPTTAGAAQTTLGGSTDAFFARLDPSTAGALALLYSTYFGGSSTDEANAIARDAAGRVYVAGKTISANFPVTPDAFQPTNASTSTEAFVVKLNPAGAGAADRLFSTYFGGTGSDTAFGVGFDSAQNILIAGVTTSSNLATQNAVQPVYQGGNQGGDGFVVKLGSDAGTFSLSGRVTNTSSGGAGFAGIPVTLSGSATGVRTTDAQGNYSFTGLAAGGTYTVAPARVNYTFNVPSQTVSNLNADTPNIDFAATVNHYTISGRVLQSGGPQNGQPLQGATVTLHLNNSGGSVLQTLSTDANGEYAFDPQAAERTYYVAPSMPAGAPRNYQFSAATGSSNTVSNLGANATVNINARPLFSVSGFVKDGSGNAIVGVSVSLQFLRSTTTDINGFYKFTDITAGDTRKIIPTLAGYNFTPVDRTYTSIGADITNFDFTGAAQTYTIAGKVTSATSQPAGQPVAGVTVKLTGSQTATTTTNQSGDYSFTVGATGNYTVTPELADHTPSPSNRTVNNIASNQTFNFTVAQKFDMRGVVKDANNQPLSGVSIQLNGSGILTTGAEGTFALNDRDGGQSYTIKPLKNGYTFSPAQEVVSLTEDKLSLTFIATPVTYTIGGAITQGAAPVAGLTVRLSSPGVSLVATATTAADGTYSFPGLASGGSYTVTPPVQAGYTFTPENRTFNNLSADQSAASFSAVPTNYNIGGTVTDAGTNPIAGVSLTLAGTNSTLTEATATTNAQGVYSFAGVPAGGNYTVTPSKPDHTFSPAAKTYNTLNNNQTGQNYTATISYSISGTLTGASGAISGATVTLSGAGTGTRTTDENGFYSFAGLVPGGTYTVTPSLADHTFDPSSRTFGTIAASQTANFQSFSTAATDLRIVKTASAQSVPVGEEVTYTLVVTNGGANAAVNVSVTDNLPSTLTFVSCAASAGGTCVGGNASGNNRTVTFASLAPGASAVATLVARVNAGVAEGTTINNTAQVSSANQDTAPGNNLSSAALSVNPEPAFDEDGKQTTNFGGSDQGAAMAVQTDGRVVVGGHAVRSGQRDFALARYDEDGSPDATFGTEGRVNTDFFGSHDLLLALAVQADGKLVAAGHAFNTVDKDFALARYNADGSLDLSFGSNGLVNTDFASGEDMGHAVAVQPDGKIVVAGVSDEDFALARYNTDGSLDTTFDGDGLVKTDFASGAAFARALAVQPDGKLVAAGFSADGVNKDFALARFNEDGSLDATFDGDGKATADFDSTGDEAYGLALQADGKLVVAGTTYSAGTGNKDFALARFNPDGSLDLTFSTDGKQTTDFEPDADTAYGVAVQKDGKLVAAGFSRVGNSDYDFGVARYLENGSLDTTFDDDGKQAIAFAQDDRAYAVALQKNGKLVTAGVTTLADGSRDFAVARLKPTGQLDAETDPETTANLVVAGTQSANPATFGASFVYTFVVTNNGPGDASGVQLADTLPAGVQFVSANTTQGTLSTPAVGSAGGTVTAHLGALFRGASATVNIQVTPSVAGQLTNTAAVSGAEADPNPANNTATVNTRVVQLTAIKLLPSTVVKGGCTTLTGSVHLSGGVAGNGGVTVALASTNPAATVPATVTIPKGASSATFAVTTSGVTANQTGTIRAELGSSTVSRGLTVTPGCP